MPQTHTTTPQWQSFEVRMRRRRIERCLARGSEALRHGIIADARAAVDEALSLDPQNADALELARRVDAAAVPGARTPARRGWPRRLTAAALIAALIGAGAMTGGADWLADRAGTLEERAGKLMQQASDGRAWSDRAAWISAQAGRLSEGASGLWARVVRREPRPAPVVSSTEVASVRRAERSAAEPVAQGPSQPVSPENPSSDIPPPSREQWMPESDSPGPRPAAADPPADPEPRSEPVTTPPRATGAGTPSPPRAGPAGSPAAAGASRAPSPAAEPAPRVETRQVEEKKKEEVRDTPAPPPTQPQPALVVRNEPPTLAALPENVAVPSSSPPAARADTPAGTSGTDGAPPPAVADEQLVRAVLGRYEAAYNALDAAAAGAVFPRIQRQLERAFEGLAAQEVTLRDCRVRVSGQEAQAECSGSARWTTRVGGGTERAQRRWTFELRNRGGEWVIEQARVR